MRVSWRDTVLGEVADQITVGHVGPMASRYTSEGVPFLRSQNVRRLHLDLSDVKHIPDDFHAELSKSRLQPGDVVVVRTGDPGACAVIPESLEDANCADLVIIRPGPDLDSRFAAYFINEVGKHHVASHLVGAVQQHFNVGAARTLPMLLPSIGEQRSIAGVLSALEDKIEQNRQTARTLERLARAIFRAWFVDFEPVKAKAEGATAFPSMPQPVFDALPTSLADSDIGPVPEGWEVKALDNVAEFLNGLALQRYPPREDGSDLPVIKIAQLRKGSTEGANTANDSIDDKYKIQDRELLFSWSGTLEAVFWFGGPGALNQHLFKVTSSEYPPWLVYEWIQQYLPEFRMIAASKATTMGHIKRGHLSQAMVASPPPAFLEISNHVLSRLFDISAAAQLESRKLGEMRDYLLPKLLSGDVRVEAANG